MSALLMLKRAISYANDESGGNSYELVLTLSGGNVIQGPHAGIDSTCTWVEICEVLGENVTFVLISSITSVQIDIAN